MSKMSKEMLAKADRYVRLFGLEEWQITYKIDKDLKSMGLIAYGPLWRDVTITLHKDCAKSEDTLLHELIHLALYHMSRVAENLQVYSLRGDEDDLMTYQEDLSRSNELVVRKLTAAMMAMQEAN